MKHTPYYIMVLVCLMLAGNLSAQSFNNFQSIQKHTISFSLTWQKKIMLGIGYSMRTGSDIQFADLNIEWKAPIDQFFSGTNYEVIAGTHIRHKASRTLLSSGYHMIYQKRSDENQQARLLDLAISFLPGYQYAAPLDDSANGVYSARFTYQPTIFAKVSGAESQQAFFAAHTIKAGAHYDVLIKRALGLGFNAYVANTFQSGNITLPEMPSWDIMGDVYFAPTYRRNLR